MKNGLAVCAAAILLPALAPRAAEALIKFDLGFGAEYAPERFRLVLDVRYDLGVGHLAPPNNSTTPQGWGRTRAWMFMLGVGI